MNNENKSKDGFFRRLNFLDLFFFRALHPNVILLSFILLVSVSVASDIAQFRFHTVLLRPSYSVWHIFADDFGGVVPKSYRDFLTKFIFDRTMVGGAGIVTGFLLGFWQSRIWRKNAYSISRSMLPSIIRKKYDMSMRTQISLFLQYVPLLTMGAIWVGSDWVVSDSGMFSTSMLTFTLVTRKPYTAAYKETSKIIDAYRNNVEISPESDLSVTFRR